MTKTLHWICATLLVGSAAAHAQGAPAPAPDALPALPGDEAIAAQQQDRTLRTVPDRPRELHLARPLDVTVGEVPNVRTAPPSDDKRYDTRREKEWTWQAPQRGTNATGAWPMPSTSGQPGTLQ